MTHIWVAQHQRVNKPLITLIFLSFSGCSKLRVTETADTESVETETQLHCSFSDDQCQIQKFIGVKKKSLIADLFLLVYCSKLSTPKDHEHQ
jgi:hypothetical protein